ncbi:MAG: hypothetical protein V3V96_15350 [Acidiferrobacterales bacterium]
MRKLFTDWAMVGFLSLALLIGWKPVSALAFFVVESTETDDEFDAAGEVSTAITVPGGTTLTAYVSGVYSVANKLWLQKESGSPGSGAWRSILQLTGTGSGLAANAQNTYVWVNERNTNSYRLFMSAAGTGDVVAQLTDVASAADYSFRTDRAFVNFFDDFFDTELLTTEGATAFKGLWLSAIDDGATGGTAATLLDTDIEGTLDLVGGTGQAATETTCLSFTDTDDQASLISVGDTYWGARVSISTIAGTIFGVGLSDLECLTGTDVPQLVDIDSTTVTPENAYTNALGFHQQGEATDVDGIEPWSNNATTAGNNADEFEAGTAVADTYYVLEGVINAAGDCAFYIDGGLVYAENECVATTAVLSPFIYVGADASGSTTTPTLTVDWVEFAFPRPAAQ